MADSPNYCRRIVSRAQPDTSWKDGFCNDPIEKKNALDWCEGCRKARLPMWPQDDAVSILVVDDTPELNPNELGVILYSKEIA